MILELVMFRLRKDILRNEFNAASRTVTDCLKTYPGFLSRTLYHVKEQDSWIDIVTWKDMPSAKAAANRIKSDAQCRNFLESIDSDSVKIIHGFSEESSCQDE
jgi:hypothetical protein